MVRWTEEQFQEYLDRNRGPRGTTIVREVRRLGPRNAKRTAVDGIMFPSKAEAAVYSKLKLVAQAEKARLYRQVRFPLLNLAPNERGVPLSFTVDFVLVHPDNKREVFDAKRAWRNREWVRGKAAFEAEYNLQVKEIEP